jgi:hypothetical protein
VSKKKIVQDLIASATKSFVKDQGRAPNNLENILLKQKAINAYLEKQKVVDFPQDKITPFYEDRPTAGIMQASKIKRPGKVIDNERTKKMFDDANKRLMDKQGFRVIPADTPEGRNISKKLGIMTEETNPRFIDYTIQNMKKMDPMDAMKEANKIIKREGSYDSLSKAEAKQILDATEDHIFQRGVKETVKDEGIKGTGAIRQAYDEAIKKGTFKGTYDEFLNYIDDLVDNDFATGGRVGYAAGGIDKMRRAFLKALGAGAATVGAAKTGLLKLGTKQAAKEAITTPSLPGKPEWFDSLVNKVIQEGTDVTKKFAFKDRQTVHRKALNEAEEVIVYRDLDTGAIDVQYGPAGNRASNDPEVINFEYRPGQMEEGVKGKTPDEFVITEAEPRYTGGPGDTDIEFDGERFVDNVDDLMQDVSNLKQYATGKKLTLKEFVDARKKRKQFEEFSENQLDQAEYLESKYGPGPEPDIDDQFASGGIAGMLGE